jgi:hypothetical protein
MARTLEASRTANSRSTSSPTSWPKLSLIFLKWSMSISSAADRLAAAHGAVDQGGELAGHVAAIVQAGELVGDRQLQRMIEVVAQEVGVALALDLGAGAGGQLLRIDRAWAARR